MTLNMDDDLDMSMRAPYISMSESSELPMLIAEDLMWGAQPDLKQTLNVHRKADLAVNSANSLPDGVDSQLKANGTYPVHNQQQTKSTMESSLAALLCNQLLQHHQQQQMAEQQMNQSQPQIIMNSNPSVKIQLMDQEGNMSISNAGALMIQTEETGLLAFSPSLSLD